MSISRIDHASVERGLAAVEGRPRAQLGRSRRWGMPMGETDHPTGDETRQAALEDGRMTAGFVAELRRRGALRALLAYAVVALAALQVVEPVVHGLRLPDWTLTAVVVALGVGFPVTIAVSWAFDLTLRGFERAAPAPVHVGGLAAAASRWPLFVMTRPRSSKRHEAIASSPTRATIPTQSSRQSEPKE